MAKPDSSGLTGGVARAGSIGIGTLAAAVQLHLPLVRIAVDRHGESMPLAA
jgi:hypothetical protein